MERVPLCLTYSAITTGATALAASGGSGFKLSGYVDRLGEVLFALNTSKYKHTSNLVEAKTASYGNQELDELVLVDGVQKTTNPGKLNHEILEATADVENASGHQIVGLSTDSDVQTSTGHSVHYAGKQVTDGEHHEQSSDAGPGGGCHFLVAGVMLNAIDGGYIAIGDPIHSEKSVGCAVLDFLDHLHYDDLL